MRLAKYWKLFDIGLQNTFVYRWNFLLRMVFGIVPLFGMVFIWQAIFAQILVLAWIFRGAIHLPVHAQTWPAFALSTAMAAGIQFFIAYAMAMIAFWVLEISTIIFLLYSFEYFLSGHIFPLDIMPAWL